MKKMLLVLMLFYSFSMLAQDEAEKAEENEKKKAENEPSDRIVFGFSFDNWIYDRDEIDSLETKWNSWGFHFYYMYDIPLGRSRLSLAPGVGFSASWVKSNSTLDDTVDSLGTIFRPIKYDYKRNSLASAFFDIPLELRYRSKPNAKNKSFKLALGCIGGVQISNHTSTKAEVNGDTKIVKVYRWEDLMKFRFGPTFRIGYGAVNLFAYYSVLSRFKNDSGPDIHPFSAGISIGAL